MKFPHHKCSIFTKIEQKNLLKKLRISSLQSCSLQVKTLSAIIHARFSKSSCFFPFWFSIIHAIGTKLKRTVAYRTVKLTIYRIKNGENYRKKFFCSFGFWVFRFLRILQGKLDEFHVWNRYKFSLTVSWIQKNCILSGLPFISRDGSGWIWCFLKFDLIFYKFVDKFHNFSNVLLAI